MGNENEQFDKMIKIIIDGDIKVGKSSIIKKCLEGKKYNVKSMGKYNSYKCYSIFQEIEGKNIKIFFVDYHTRSDHVSLVSSQVDMTDVFLFVYDISNTSTFVYIQDYFNKSYKDFAKKNNSIMILIGNKTDLSDRKVEKEGAENYAKENGMLFIETSVVNGQGINELFNLIMEKITKRINDTFDIFKKNNTTPDQKELKLEEDKNSIENNSTNASVNESSKIIKLYDEIAENQKEIKDLKSKLSRAPFILSENEKLMSVIFYAEEQIFYSVICKNTDKFLKIEEEFYEKYPNLKSENNIFYANNSKIEKYETLSNNNIQNSDIIILKKA